MSPSSHLIPSSSHIMGQEGGELIGFIDREKWKIIPNNTNNQLTLLGERGKRHSID
jgi:hypothetical protein